MINSMNRKNAFLPLLNVASVLVCTAFFACADLGSRGPAVSAGPTVSSMSKLPGNVHVLELFTSEGCSSCPAADRLLNKVKAEGDSAVFVLSYHVDYWDYLGWKDPFSQAAFSNRQREYARRFQLESIYTPQVVVDGGEEFVGSDESRLRAALTKITPAAVSIMATAATAGQKAVQVSYSLSSAEGLSLHLAVVQTEATTDVKRGENGGRTLQHVNVVRELITADAKPAGTIEIRLPDNINPESLSLIVFVQEKGSGKITGAVQTSIPLQKGV